MINQGKWCFASCTVCDRCASLTPVNLTLAINASFQIAHQSESCDTACTWKWIRTTVAIWNNVSTHNTDSIGLVWTCFANTFLIRQNTVGEWVTCGASVKVCPTGLACDHTSCTESFGLISVQTWGTWDAFGSVGASETVGENVRAF